MSVGMEFGSQGIFLLYLFLLLYIFFFLIMNEISEEISYEKRRRWNEKTNGRKGKTQEECPWFD